MAVRNVEDLNLDEITEEMLTEQAKDMGEALGVDTREGSVYMDAAAGHIKRTAEFFDKLRDLFDIFSIYTCTGEVLDEHLKEKGMVRDPVEETPATYKCYFIGASPEVGATVMVDEYDFVVTEQDPLDSTCWYIRSEETGTDMNYFASGTAVIPDDDIEELESCTLGDLYIPAVDIEEDDPARDRLLTSVGMEVEAGNAAQMQKWCLDIDGVGRAEIFPLEDGPGTTSVYIISEGGGVPTQAVVDAVQEYLDPGANGEGEGMATIGCAVSVSAASAFEITVTGEVIYQSGVDLDALKAAVESNIVNYFRSRALKATGTPRQVFINTVGYNILAVEGVTDYTDLELNDSSGNLTYTAKQTPILKENNLTYSVISSS